MVSVIIIYVLILKTRYSNGSITLLANGGLKLIHPLFSFTMYITN